MAAKQDKAGATERPDRGPRADWRLAAAAVLVAIVLSSLLYAFHRAPFEQLYVRMFPDSTGSLFNAIRSRLARETPADYLRYTAVEFACRAVEAYEHGEIHADQALEEISSCAAGDPKNNVFELLHLYVVLTAAESDARAQFDRVAPLLDATKGMRIDFGLASQRTTWGAELAYEFGDAATGALVAADLCVPQHLAMIRRLHLRTLALADALIAGGQTAPALACCAAIVDWSRRAVESTVDVDEVWVWMDGAAAAHERAALVHARDGRIGDARTATTSAGRLRNFREALFRKCDAEAVNGLANPGSPARRTTTRPQLYETTLKSLLAAGLALATAGLACVVGIVATAMFVVVSLFDREKTPSCPLGAKFAAAQLGVGAMLVAPHLMIVAGIALNPLDVNRLIERDTLVLTFYNVCLATFLALLASAALAARAAMADRWGRRFWPVFAVIAFVGLYGAAYGDYVGFVSDAHAVWTSSATVISRERMQSLARFLLVCSLLAPLTGIIVHAVRWMRAPSERSLNTMRLKAYLKHLAVVSFCWWAMAAVLAISTAADSKQPLRDFTTLTLEDARDGVAARMGPRWREAFTDRPSR